MSPRLPAAHTAVAALSLVVTLAACAHGPAAPDPTAAPRRAPHAAVADLPPRADPPLDLDDDEDLARARAELLALDPADPARAARRAELFASTRRRVDRALEANAPDVAFLQFQRALPMWDANELEGTSPPGDLAAAAEVAERLFQRFARRGGELECTTAIAVIVAARPAEAARWQAIYDEISAYLDGLAVARHGPGAERSRQIAALEDVLGRFPSRWAGETLVRLYLERHAALQLDVRNIDRRPGLIKAHGDKLRWTTWNVVLAYARIGRLADAPPAVDPLAGQIGDVEEIRVRLRAALASDATGMAWVALAGAYAPDPRRADLPGDLAAMHDVCATGARRLPSAPEPRDCAGRAAAGLQLYPLAVRWLEEAARLAPTDRDAADMLARLYQVQLADKVQAERLDAARAELARLEAFYRAAGERWPGQPLDLPLATAYLTMGRGLYAAGEVGDALAFFQRVQALAPDQDALEHLATIRAKRGESADAAREFLAAAELARGATGDDRLERPRLLRLAGEALADANDPDRARDARRAALADIDDLVDRLPSPGKDKPDPDRARLLGERGRLLYALGEADAARRAFDASVDAAPDAASGYADVIAFLLTRGHHEPALDAFHRALGRATIEDYFKVYTSIWILGFARVRGAPEDPLALEYLRSRTGSGWRDHLARFAVGAIRWEELRARASTRGERAEAYFYEALARYARRDRAGAEEMLRMVLGTDMYGFFEFDMAVYFLRHGPPR